MLLATWKTGQKWSAARMRCQPCCSELHSTATELHRPAATSLTFPAVSGTETSRKLHKLQSDLGLLVISNDDSKDIEVDLS